MPAFSPARAANVATHAWLSFTPKSWGKFLVFMSAIYAWPFSAWSDLNHRPLYLLWAACRWWLVEAQTKIKFHHMCFNFSHLCSRSPTLHWPWPCFMISIFRNTWMLTFHHRDIFECAHLKFVVSGQSKQTSIHTVMHVQCCRVSVGSPRLAPILSGHKTSCNLMMWE